MKRTICLLWVFVLLVSLTGCLREEPAAEPPAPEEEPLQLEILAVEISRGDIDPQTLMAAVQELPQQLQEYFASEDVEIGQVVVTVGAAPADTAQALAAGTIDLAFLPAEAFLEYGGEALALLADAAEGDGGVMESGTRALICAAPTEYGAQLNSRSSSGKALSWNELAQARWGVLEAKSLGGYRCFDLWLADEYQGSQISDLPQVTQYGSYEELFRAAAAEEIDALACRSDVRTDAAQVWDLHTDQTDENGTPGFGRTQSIWQEVPVLEVTERLYSQLAAVAGDSRTLSDGRFAAALERVLERLAQEDPERMQVLGAEHFVTVTDGELDATRRMLTLMG